MYAKIQETDNTLLGRVPFCYAHGQAQLCTISSKTTTTDKRLLILEHIGGLPLSQALGQRLSYAWSHEHMATMREYLKDTLRQLHRNGIVHRDVRHENIIISDKGRPILLDFGLAALSCRVSPARWRAHVDADMSAADAIFDRILDMQVSLSLAQHASTPPRLTRIH